MKNKEQLKKKIFNKKIVLVIVFITFLLGLLFGSIYITILDNNNKKEIIISVKNYFNNFNNFTFSNKLDMFKTSFINNLIYFISIWALGISIIGLPVIIIMIFLKSFQTGFSIASIFSVYKFKGLLGIIIYIFPSNIILLLYALFLGAYSINLSINLFSHSFKKKSFNFNFYMGKYLLLLFISILLSIFSSFFDSFISPYLFKIFLKMIK